MEWIFLDQRKVTFLLAHCLDRVLRQGGELQDSAAALSSHLGPGHCPGPAHLWAGPHRPQLVVCLGNRTLATIPSVLFPWVPHPSLCPCPVREHLVSPPGRPPHVHTHGPSWVCWFCDFATPRLSGLLFDTLFRLPGHYRQVENAHGGKIITVMLFKVT